MGLTELTFDLPSLQASEFSWPKALSLGLASKLVYHPKTGSLIFTAVKSWGFEHCEVVERTGFKCLVAWNSQSILVSFCGAESVGDWLLSLSPNVGFSPSGFRDDFSALFTSVQADLNSVLHRAFTPASRLWLTGHGVGGAMALIAASEWHTSFQIDGVYTFGQPKTVFPGWTGDAAAVSSRLYRFVNAKDIVPQLPPGAAHVGYLVWFDRLGEVQHFDGPPDALGQWQSDRRQITPTEWSQSQLQSLQNELTVLRREDASDKAEFERSVQAIVPGVLENDISRYLRRIRGLASQFAEVDSLLESQADLNYGRAFALESASSSFPPTTSMNQTPVLFRVKSTNWTPPAGMKVQSRIGTIITAQCSKAQLDLLKTDSGVVSIESSRDGGMFELATSGPFVRCSGVQRPPIDERGDGAIVALIDSGIDVLHGAFLDGAGRTRIIAVWDQRSSEAGKSPHDCDPIYSQNYGRLYSQSDIQRMVDNLDSTPAGMRDPLAHGTHVASIACGRSVGPFYGGMAPEAKIVVVMPNMVTKPGYPPSIGYSNSHVDALSFIQTIAQKNSLPVAVNVSLGMNAGAHDGTSPLEAAFDEFSGGGEDAGYVVVKSAGNERGRAGHAAAQVAQGGRSTIAWSSSNALRNQDYIEVWFSAADDISFTLIDPTGLRSGTVSGANRSNLAGMGGNQCRLSVTLLHRNNGDNLLVILVSADTNSIQSGRWTLEMVGNSILDGGQVHAWVERDDARAVAFQTGDTDEMTLSIPATARRVITVAACDSAIPLNLTEFSSFGLTRDSRNKPDISAPGTGIMAARANTADHQETIAMSGTSMAAPHVTGAIALLMSRLHKYAPGQQVNAQQVQKALVLSARNFTGRHNPGFGFGALDVEAFIQKFPVP